MLSNQSLFGRSFGHLKHWWFCAQNATWEGDNNVLCLQVRRLGFGFTILSHSHKTRSVCWAHADSAVSAGVVM